MRDVLVWRFINGEHMRGFLGRVAGNAWLVLPERASVWTQASFRRAAILVAAGSRRE